MKANKHVWLLCFLLVFALSATAQKSKIITYRIQVYFDGSDVDNLMKEVKKERGEEEDSFSNVLLKELKLFIEEKVNNSALPDLIAWREGANVVTTESKEPNGKLKKYYNVDNLEFIVIDSLASGKVETFRNSMDYRTDTSWNMVYNVKETSEKKNILGYDCSLFTIEETKKTGIGSKADNRTFAVWATTQIQPALSVHAVLGLYDKILPNLTPLEIEERFLEARQSHQKITAISIK